MQWGYFNSYVNPAWHVDDMPDDGVLTFEKVLCLSERTRNVRDDFLVEARICPNYFGFHFILNLTATSL